MRRRLTLRGPNDRRIFRTLMIGFLSSAPENETKGRKEVIYQLSRVKKALNACAAFVPFEAPANAQDTLTDAAAALVRDHDVVVTRAGMTAQLKDGEYVLDLAQGDFDVLEKAVIETPWLRGAVEDVADTLDRLSSAETVTEGTT